MGLSTKDDLIYNRLPIPMISLKMITGAFIKHLLYAWLCSKLLRYSGTQVFTYPMTNKVSELSKVNQ